MIEHSEEQDDMKIKDTLASVIYHVFSRDREEHPVPREQEEKIHTALRTTQTGTKKKKTKGEDNDE